MQHRSREAVCDVFVLGFEAEWSDAGQDKREGYARI